MRGLLAVALLLVVGTVAAAPAGAASSVESVHDRVVAAEVCEPMVADVAVAAAGRTLTSEPKGRWTGTRYTCRYDFGPGGVLLARVRVYDDAEGSKEAFASRRRKAERPTTLYGLGSGAFKVGGKVLVARKDNFVLTVDGRKLAAAVGPNGVVFSATRAVFDCW
jgi:hypothetical protein